MFENDWQIKRARPVLFVKSLAEDMTNLEVHVVVEDCQYTI